VIGIEAYQEEGKGKMVAGIKLADQFRLAIETYVKARCRFHHDCEGLPLKYFSKVQVFEQVSLASI
jgi:hypothetical protein